MLPQASSQVWGAALRAEGGRGWRADSFLLWDCAPWAGSLVAGQWQHAARSPSARGGGCARALSAGEACLLLLSGWALGAGAVALAEPSVGFLLFIWHEARGFFSQSVSVVVDKLSACSLQGLPLSVSSLLPLRLE